MPPGTHAADSQSPAHALRPHLPRYGARPRCSAKRLVLNSLLGLLLEAVGGVGSVCWEVATFWAKVRLAPVPC